MRHFPDLENMCCGLNQWSHAKFISGFGCSELKIRHLFLRHIFPVSSLDLLLNMNTKLVLHFLEYYTMQSHNLASVETFAQLL